MVAHCGLPTCRRRHAAMDKPMFHVGPIACFCACNPSQGSVHGSAGSARQSARGDNELVVSDEEEVPQQRLAALRRREQAAVRSGAPRPYRQHCSSQRSCTSFHEASPSEVSTASPTIASAIEVPSLGPVGCGGWHMEEDVTEEMREATKLATEMYAKRQKKALTEFNERFLTSVTLANYVDPVAPQHLVNALIGRARSEDILCGRKPVYLCSSFRVIGWDAAGASVLAVEPSTLRNSLAHALPQVEYLGWTAFDLNRPGANGFVVVVDFGGGFNPLHFLNPKPILDLAGLLEGQWRRRLKAALFIDVPGSFNGILNTFLMFVKANTRDKIRVVPSMQEAVKELERMGCDQETFENAQQYLSARRDRAAKPCFHPLVDYSFFRERLADMHLSAESEYITQEVHNRLRDAIQEFRIHRWGVLAAAPGGQELELSCAPKANLASAFALAGGSPARAVRHTEAAVCGKVVRPKELGALSASPSSLPQPVKLLEFDLVRHGQELGAVKDGSSRGLTECAAPLPSCWAACFDILGIVTEKLCCGAKRGRRPS